MMLLTIFRPLSVVSFQSSSSLEVLGTKTGSQWKGVALTRDHKPNLKDLQGEGSGRVPLEGL